MSGVTGQHCTCGKEATSRCVNCRKVWYCSREHQKKDWKSHKNTCFPAKVCSNEVCGRFLMATKPISEGTLIFKEVPLFSAPNGKSGLFLLCLGCHGIIQDVSNKDDYCQICKWPLHRNCSDNRVHKDNECGIFSKQKLSFLSNVKNIYDKILVLRGVLLKLRDPTKWALLQQLQSHRNERMATEEGKSLSLAMTTFILSQCGLNNQLEETDVDHVVGVITVNAYVTEDNLSSSPDFKCGSYVYFTGSMPAHNCTPNAKWTIENNGELKLFALRDIGEEESLCHCYAWGGVGTLERQKHLLMTKFFICSCARCKDPEELGTFFSGVACPSDACRDFLLSDSPLKRGSTWTCRACGSRMTEIEVEKLIKSLREAHTACAIVPSSTISSREDNGQEDWRDTLTKLENHRSHLLTKVHPNHFLVHEVDQDILLKMSSILINPEEQTSSHEEIRELAEKQIAMSKACISLMNTIAPGITTHSGRQLYYLQQGLGMLLADKIKQQEERQNTPSKELYAQVEEWKAVRQRGLQMLEMESKAREEYVLGQAMKD